MAMPDSEVSKTDVDAIKPEEQSLAEPDATEASTSLATEESDVLAPSATSLKDAEHMPCAALHQDIERPAEKEDRGNVDAASVDGESNKGEGRQGESAKAKEEDSSAHGECLSHVIEGDSADNEEGTLEGEGGGEDDTINGLDVDEFLDEMGLESRAPADRATVAKRGKGVSRPTGPNAKRSSSDTNLKDGKRPQKKAKKASTAPPSSTAASKPREPAGEGSKESEPRSA